MRAIAVLVLVSAIVTAAQGQEPTDAQMQRKLELAQRYVVLTGRERRIESALAAQLRLTFDGCADEGCRIALDQDIATAIRESGAEHEKATVKLFASRLTEEELRAAISFAQSPQGQAIVAAEDEMSGDLQTIARTFSTGSFGAVRLSFCKAQPDACARAFSRSTTKISDRP